MIIILYIYVKYLSTPFNSQMFFPRPPGQDLKGHHETAVSSDGRRTTRL